jgi:hypothetical protein
LDVSEACKIHDWYYRFWWGETERDRAEADRIGRNNVMRIIDYNGGRRWLVLMRKWLAHKAYKKVRRYGALAFFEERNKGKNYREIENETD